MSQSGLHREKNPVAVKEAIISAACHMVVTNGLASVTLQAVADRAGITKSGLIHHFNNKNALISALRTHAFDLFSQTLAGNMQKDSGGNGVFTRAYIRTCLESVRKHSDLLLITTLWTDPDMRSLWYEWLAKWEAMYSTTDSESIYKIARLATDGAWLAARDGMNTKDVEIQLLSLASVGK